MFALEGCVHIVVAPYRWFRVPNPSIHLERALLSGADLHKLQTLQEEETHPYTRTHTLAEFLLFPVLNLGHYQVLRFFFF